VVTKEELRDSMARFATGVTVVTTLDDEGSVHGMTANSFTSVCLEPPLILVCVGFRTHTHPYVEHRKAFGINILSEEQKEIGAYFARKPEDRHGEVPYTKRISEKGLPIIEGSLAFFGCQVVDSNVHGDHTIYIAKVDEVCLGNPGRPLLFYESKFTNL
jgi:flavin reductase (DIM6/NTAB) family NADH-FMN oxidoreductase RutF